jgi:hypothetical protein
MLGNPWIREDADAAPQPEQPETRPAPLRPRAPQAATVSRPDSGGLGAWDAGPAGRGPAWWWTSCHGGAGVSTLCELVPGGADGGRGWPVARDGGPTRVILVARTNALGLRAAQTAARQWASGALPTVQLLGLAAVADAPGRLPKALQDLLKLVGGGFPHVWTIPWIDALRFGETPAQGALPKPVVRMAAELSQSFHRTTGRMP